MKLEIEICPDCKAQLLRLDGPVHEYLGGSASCWQKFGELLTKEYSDDQYMKFHRWTVDAYAAQHPGKPETRTIQSIHVHLLALYLQVERNVEPTFIAKIMQRVTETKKGLLGWLSPPEDLGRITVVDVLEASSPEDHGEKVIAWGHCVWHAWKAHHPSIKCLAEEFL